MPAPAPVAARTWHLDPATSTLYVLVRYERGTALASMGHDHTVAATGWSGSVRWDPADPAACDVRIDAPVAGLRVDPPGLRARAGLDGETDPADLPKILDNATGPKQLDGARFPKIAFQSTSCAKASGGADRFVVNGTFTMHGASKAVSVPMAISATDAAFAASGGFDLSTADFGFSPFSAAMGALRNQDRLSFTVSVKGGP